MAAKKLSTQELGAKAIAEANGGSGKKKAKKKASKKGSKKTAKKRVAKDPLHDLAHCARVVKRAKQMIHDADARPTLSKKR